jgi:hypothetical protein
MDDPVKTLKTLLETDWSLDDTLAAERIMFRTEEPLRPNTRFVSKNISVEIKSVASGATPRNEARTVFRETVAVDVWVRITPSTEAGKETALDNKRKLIEEIRRIVKAHRHRESNIDFKYFGGDKTLNGLGEEPPFFRTIANVVCIYNV